MAKPRPGYGDAAGKLRVVSFHDRGRLCRHKSITGRSLRFEGHQQRTKCISPWCRFFVEHISQLHLQRLQQYATLPIQRVWRNAAMHLGRRSHHIRHLSALVAATTLVMAHLELKRAARCRRCASQIAFTIITQVKASKMIPAAIGPATGAINSIAPAVIEEPAAQPLA